jgi:demethoxyubiquinone hydroxylase (CLK1/Coq7/Cat5 family)
MSRVGGEHAGSHRNHGGRIMHEIINTPQAYAREQLQTQPIEQLKSFCRGEMSAVDTYHRAIEVTKQAWVLDELRKNLMMHEEHVHLLKQRIVELDGNPPESAGPWGAFANMLEGVAAAISENAALAILEEGERHGLADYKSDLSNLDYESLRLIERRIIPQQTRTHIALHEIVRALTA